MHKNTISLDELAKLQTKNNNKKYKEKGPSICIARRRQYTSNAHLSLKLSRKAV